MERQPRRAEGKKNARSLTLLVLAQTLEMVSRSTFGIPNPRASRRTTLPAKLITHGWLKRHPVKASGLHLIGNETEPGWEQAEDISTSLPSLVSLPGWKRQSSQNLQQSLNQTSLSTLQRRTGLSRHVILRARRGERIRPRSLRRLSIEAGTVPIQES